VGEGYQISRWKMPKPRLPCGAKNPSMSTANPTLLIAVNNRPAAIGVRGVDRAIGLASLLNVNLGVIRILAIFISSILWIRIP